MYDIDQGFAVLQQRVEKTGGVGVLRAVAHSVADTGTLEQIQRLIVSGIIDIQSIVKIVVHDVGGPDRVGPHVPNGLEPAEVVFLPRVIGCGIVSRQAGGYVHAPQKERDIFLSVPTLKLRSLCPKGNVYSGTLAKAQVKTAVKYSPIAPDSHCQQQNSRRYKSFHFFPLLTQHLVGKAGGMAVLPQGLNMFVHPLPPLQKPGLQLLNRFLIVLVVS